MGEAEGQQILRLVPAHWLLEIGPGVSGYRALGVPVLVPAQWCVELGPGLPGGQGHAQGWLGAQEVFFILIFIYLFIYLFLAALGLICSTRDLSIVAHGLFVVVHRLSSCGA